MVFTAVKDLMCSPMVYVMHASEIRNGREVFDGSNAPFKMDDLFFANFPVFSWDKNNFYIVALQTAYAGQGILKKLVSRSISAGLTPCIVEPVGGIMPSWLERNGWHEHKGFYSDDPAASVWTPNAKGP